RAQCRDRRRPARAAVALPCPGCRGTPDGPPVHRRADGLLHPTEWQTSGWETTGGTSGPRPASAGEEVGQPVRVVRRQVQRAAAQDLERLLALVLVEALHQQDAVEVVELVLEHPALELGRLQGELVAAGGEA